MRSVASLPSDEYYTTVYSELPPTKRPQETGEGRPERKFVFYNTLIPQHVYNICTAPLSITRNISLTPERTLSLEVNYHEKCLYKLKKRCCGARAGGAKII